MHIHVNFMSDDQTLLGFSMRKAKIVEKEKEKTITEIGLGLLFVSIYFLF